MFSSLNLPILEGSTLLARLVLGELLMLSQRENWMECLVPFPSLLSPQLELEVAEAVPIMVLLLGPFLDAQLNFVVAERVPVLALLLRDEECFVIFCTALKSSFPPLLEVLLEVLLESQLELGVLEADWFLALRSL